VSARRPYGTGSLFERGGSWYGQWRIDGRQVKRRLGSARGRDCPEGLTRPQAERELRREIAEVRPPARGGALSVAGAGDRYIRHLETVKGRKRSTTQDYRIILRLHLVPHFAAPLGRITARDVDAFVESQLAAGAARQSVLNRLNLLSGIFTFAVHSGWVEASPVAAATRPSPSPDDAELRFLTPEEVEAVIREVPDDLHGATERPLYLAAAMTGLRQGELVALRWRDVDWSAGVVRVARSYSRGQLGRPKSRRSIRAVPMADRVGAALEGHFQRSNYRADDDLVFCHPETGRYLDAFMVRRRFRTAAERAGVRPVRFHDLRHTFGTVMAAEGAPIRDLMAWMGHADLKTTLRYAHHSPGASRGAEFVNSAFGSGSDRSRSRGPT
jgi:integrase